MHRYYQSEVVSALESEALPSWERARICIKISLAKAAIHLVTRPEGRLLLITVLSCILVMLLPSAITGSRIVAFDLIRPGLVLLVSICATLAMPNRQYLHTNNLRIAILYLLACTCAIPLISPWLPNHPHLAYPFLFAAASIIATIALTAAYLASAWIKSTNTIL